jgi:hypothetical protein
MEDDFNWVKARAECSLVVIFEKLKLGLRADVEKRQALLGPDSPYKFNLVIDSTNATVLIEGRGEQGSVSFRLKKVSIQVFNSNEQEILTAFPTLNDKGECRLKINNQERELWYLRKMALEEIFFREY